MLDSRLFKANSSDRFCYWHRRIGEFLGARYLTKQADSKLKRKRLLSLFHSYGVVPASLRGIHAWLARDPTLAQEVINADPMGVIEYGDADNISVEQARTLLSALELLAENNPHFFNRWETYSIQGVLQPGLIEHLRRLNLSYTNPV